ncbi:MAG: AAA family ATPase [Eubacteriales bacterium]|nr:AAA family ATPase [Eubacteriales bacterium]
MYYEKIKSVADAIVENAGKVIYGKQNEIRLITAALLCGGHVLLDDIPGTGKTTLAKALAKTIAADTRRIQFTPDLLPSDVTGINFYNQKTGDFVFRAGPVFTNILLADEINRTTPRTQSALLECMAEGQATIDGVSYPLPQPFFVIATQNPVEMQGTFPLPEAQLDRFLLCLSLGYPEKEQELALLSRPAAVPESKPVATAAQLLAARQELARVTVSAAVQEYLVELAHASREHRGIQLGLSTRGMLSLLEVSRAAAAMHGRTYVTPDDIKWIAADCMAHRMTARGSMWEENQETCRSIAEELLQTVPVPKESLWN